jgi:Zn ribbon nucleic-acid-binding protein
MMTTAISAAATYDAATLTCPNCNLQDTQTLLWTDIGDGVEGPRCAVCHPDVPVSDDSPQPHVLLLGFFEYHVTTTVQEQRLYTNRLVQAGYQRNEDGVLHNTCAPHVGDLGDWNENARVTHCPVLRRKEALEAWQQ